MTLYDLLALDSIYNFLTYDERLNTHFVIRKKETELNPKSKKALNWIKDNYWESPEMKYDKNKNLRYFSFQTNSFEHIKNFKSEFPKITNHINEELY